MDIKMYKALEFDKIKQMLSSFATSYLGKEAALDISPADNINIVSKLQKETSEAVTLLLRKSNPPLDIVANIEPILKKVSIGGVLNITELLSVANILKLSRKLKEYFIQDKIDLTEVFILSNYFNELYSNPGVENEIYRCIKSEDEIDSRASKELNSIRRKIIDAQEKIKSKLDDMIHSSSTSKYLQDPVVTFRNDRFVIPVKQEYKSEVPGFVHDSSSSGSTLFIEPVAVFNLNNEIKELKIKEQIEIERILAELTQLVLPLIEDLDRTFNLIGKIDFAFAKAKFALSLDCYEPVLNTNGYINFKKARHPLIDKSTVVPIDFWIGKDFNSLIVTGPNTGGKTVTLKTVGTLVVMAQCGLHIPVGEGSEVSIFKNVFTDIGDEQSIELSLSTFSSHMTNIVKILERASKDDLVLLDELGSGTDPVEGAALAMSILEYLHSKNCTVLATTHYSELKTFAIQTEGIENASCEFNVETLRPTYKLLIGLPGKSNAFAISQKLGLSENILRRAGQFLTAENIRFEDVLNDMEKDRRKAREERELSQKLLSDAEEIKNNIDAEKAKFETTKSEILSKAKQEARDILLDAEEEANRLIKELTNLKKSKNNINKEAETIRTKLKKSISEMQKDLVVKNVSSKGIDSDKIKIGLHVYIPSLEQKGIINSMPDKKGNVIVQAGLVKLTINISQLEIISENENSKKFAINNLVQNKSQNISSEIKLLGYTVDEAVSELEKYIDDAYLSNLPAIRIVHGKGSGSLRKGIHEFLKNHPHIKSFRLGALGEGDTGVTIAELK
jgi:DNA mismatch repair protein MutS2